MFSRSPFIFFLFFKNISPAFYFLHIRVQSGASNGSMYIPKILYASRTHTQLSQTVKELKATVYNPTVSVLASREQLCIDKHVMEVESNAAKTAVCRQKVKQRMCGHYIGFEQSTVVSAFPRRTSPSFLLHRSLWCRSHPSPLPLPSRSFVFQYLLSFFRI